MAAITKCDSERADPARVRQQLVTAGLELEDVGGTVQARAAAPLLVGLGLRQIVGAGAGEGRDEASEQAV